MSTDYEKNVERCKRIADELDAYADGLMYADADGEIQDLTDYEDMSEAPDDWTPLNATDWAADALDYTITIGADGRYRSSSWCVAFGGPGIWCDTSTQTVELRWWGESASYPLSQAAVDALDELAEEAFETMRRC